jgi:prevent-host-death family protein
MKSLWQLQEAKNRFSEVVERALREGPQTVTRRGEPVVVVVGYGDYRKRTRPKKSVAEVLRECPVSAEELDLARAKDVAREVVL